MKVIEIPAQIVFVAIMMLGPALVLAGHDQGNGGDGIIFSRGKTQLFDFAETKFDVERNMSDHYTHYKDWRNYNLENQLKERQGYHEFALAHVYHKYPPSVPRGSEFNKEIDLAEKQLNRALAALLTRLAREHSPSLSKAIYEKLKELEWHEALTDRLVPNPDTQSALDPSQYQAIGCARTTGKETIFASYCARTMSLHQRVGLIIHESVYAVVKEKNPTLTTSTQVRQLVRAIFSSGKSQVYELLRRLGVNEFAQRDSAISKLFGGSIRQTYECKTTIVNALVSKVVVNMQGAFIFNTNVYLSKEVLPNETQMSFCGFETKGSMYRCAPEDDHGWKNQEIEYDLDQRTLRWQVYNAVDDNTPWYVDGPQFEFAFDISSKKLSLVHLNPFSATWDKNLLNCQEMK